MRKPRSRACPPDGKRLFITFDDGPSAAYTPELLALLSENGVHATFFMVAEFAREHPEIVAQVMKDGHLIGLHSLSHRCALAMGPRETKEDLNRSFAIMHQMGVEVKWYRAPWGLINLTVKRELKKRNVQTVFWDVMTEDWRGDTTAEIIADKLRRRTRDGSVVCLHDGRGENNAPARTVEALREVLPEWRAEGCRFLRLDQQ